MKLLLEQSRYDELLLYDQLKQQHKLQRVFVNFTEGDIRFMPTYKYDPGTDNWDSSEKNRPPAWCDRILWSGGPTKQLAYRSHSQLKLSDHKPVSALFRADVKVVSIEKHRKVYEEVMKELDKRENDCLPQVNLNRNEVNFRPVSYREEAIEVLTITNTGQVPVHFRFLNKPNQFHYCKKWLTVDPNEGSIIPGRTACVELKVFVDRDSGAELNRYKPKKDQEKLNDILVLHLEHGRDLFITINGRFLPSCFGSSINALVRLRTAVRETDEDMFVKLQELPLVPEVPCEYEPCWDIPKEVWMLVDHLYRRIDEAELFGHSAGLHSEFIAIRDSLDHAYSDKLTGSVHSVAEALLLLLESFPEPVIPFCLYQRALDCRHFGECKNVRLRPFSIDCP